VSAAMFAQVLDVQGAETEVATHVQIQPRNLRELAVRGFDTAVIAFLNPNSLGHGRFLVRRLKRASPRLRVGIVLWDAESMAGTDLEVLAHEISADFVATRMTDAVVRTLSNEPPVKPDAPKLIRRRGP